MASAAYLLCQRLYQGAGRKMSIPRRMYRSSISATGMPQDRQVAMMPPVLVPAM